MERTYQLPCHLSKAEADELNQESGRIYTQVMVTHWRIYRKKGIWLSQSSAEKLNDDLGRQTILHAHSRDAAQQGFYKACKTTQALRKAGYPEARYPHKRKRFRTTVWKNTGIRIRHGFMLLAKARGLEPIKVKLSGNFASFTSSQVKEVRLYFNRSSQRYEWHIVIAVQAPIPVPGSENVIAIDLGEIHPTVA